MPTISRVAGGLAALAMWCAATPAMALLVQPVVIDLQTSGDHNTAAITITNDRNRADTVEVTVNKLALPENGAPVLTPDKGDNFLIFPPIVTIQPGKTQVVRIRWIGEPVIAQSQMYMFSTSELPVDQAKGSGVQLVYSIQSVVTVTSPALKPDVSVLSAERQTKTIPAAPDKPATTVSGVAVTFQNAGNAIDYLMRYRVTFKDGDWSKTFETPDVNAAVGLGLLGPDSKRDLFFPLSGVPAAGPLTVSIEVAPAR